MRTAPIRHELLDLLSESIRQHAISVLLGPVGLGQSVTTSAAVARIEGWAHLVCNGDWTKRGYLAGVHELIGEALAWCESNAGDVISRHQQSLKRMLPLAGSKHFDVPKDLTNTSTREERTRFYHHEYQIKLLVGISEFLLDYLRTSERSVILEIEAASFLSPTTRNLIKTLVRMPSSFEHIRFVLHDNDALLFFEAAAEVRFPRYNLEEFTTALNLSSSYPAKVTKAIYGASRGNMLIADALVRCYDAGIRVVDYLDANALIDLYLATLSAADRLDLLKRYVAADFVDIDPIVVRNFETLPPAVVDPELVNAHLLRLREYQAGRGRLITVHALAIHEAAIRLKELVEPSETLKSIGLYDTWFSYFGSIFSNPELRQSATGESPSNGVFINAAFVLYSLGCSRASVPFLDEFYERFPTSKFIPTVLYAQSMTYGRYQIPVNLDLAETYAVRNLQVIERQFRDAEKYDYIKVFAENAYAYIKARQGKFSEALELCLSGNKMMKDVYGEERFKLHQSILVYNTSQIYEIVRDFELAERQLRLAIRYDPYYGEYYNDLGNLLSKVEGRFDDAMAAYDRAIELSPPYFEAFLNRGLLRLKRNDNAAARRDFEKALHINPAEWRAHLELGNLNLAEGRFADAVAAYEAALALEPGNADLRNNAGLAYSELGNSAVSIDHYREAIRVQERHAPAHNNLAVELFNAGDRQAALIHARKAAELSGDPDYERTLSAIQVELT